MLSYRHVYRLDSLIAKYSASYYSHNIYTPHLSKHVLHQSPINIIPCMRFSNDSKMPGLKERYENYLRKNYPKVYSVYMRVLEGTKSCFSEIKTYFKLRKDLYTKKRQLTDLNREELEILIQVREELPKLLTIVLIAPLPMAIPSLGLAMIFFPRYVMTRHFWTDEQRRTFWLKNIATAQYRYFKPIVDNLPKKHHLPVPLSRVSEVEILPIDRLPISAWFPLARVHKCWTPLGLRNRAEILKTLDSLLLRNINIIDTFTEQQLYMHLYMRQINYANLSSDQMKANLKEWIYKSPAFSKDVSVYLHAPIIIQYNTNSKV